MMGVIETRFFGINPWKSDFAVLSSKTIKQTHMSFLWLIKINRSDSEFEDTHVWC